MDALPGSGGVVYLPSGLYVLMAGLVIDKPNVTLQGDGNFFIGWPPSSLIQPAAYDQFTLVTVRRRGFRMRDIQLDGLGKDRSLGSHDCPGLEGLGVSGNEVSHCSLENVSLQYAPRYGLHLQDVFGFLAVNSEMLFHGSDGIHAVGLQPGRSGSIRLLGTGMNQNKGRGASFSGVGSASLVACALESNQGGPGIEEGNALDALNCPAIQVLGCYYENSPSPRARRFRAAAGSKRAARTRGPRAPPGPARRGRAGLSRRARRAVPRDAPFS